MKAKYPKDYDKYLVTLLQNLAKTKVVADAFTVQQKDLHDHDHDHDHHDHDHDHQHESFARLKEKVYNRILSETYNIYT